MRVRWTRRRSRADILFVMTNVPPASLGGAEILNLALLRQLRERGWRVSLLGRDAGELPAGMLGIPADRLYRLHASSHYCYMLKLVIWLVVNVRRFRVVHFVDADQLSGVGLLVTRLSRVPRILRYESEVGLLRERLSRARVPFVQSLALRGLRSADAVVYVSQMLRTGLVSYLGYPESTLNYVPNGVDERRFLAPLPDDRDDVVLCPARLRAEKNHLHLLDVWKVVVAEVPTARLWLVGDGPMEEVLRERVAALGISASVVFWGYQNEMSDFYRRSRLCVLLSKSEADPMVLLEAGAAAIPCVASAVGGIPAAIQDGLTGLLVHPADVESAAFSIVSLLLNRSHAARMGARARHYVSENRSMRGLIDAYEMLIRRLIECEE